MKEALGDLWRRAEIYSFEGIFDSLLEGTFKLRDASRQTAEGHRQETNLKRLGQSYFDIGSSAFGKLFTAGLPGAQYGASFKVGGAGASNYAACGLPCQPRRDGQRQPTGRLRQPRRRANDPDRAQPVRGLGCRHCQRQHRHPQRPDRRFPHRRRSPRTVSRNFAGMTPNPGEAVWYRAGRSPICGPGGITPPVAAHNRRHRGGERLSRSACRCPRKVGRSFTETTGCNRGTGPRLGCIRGVSRRRLCADPGAAGRGCELRLGTPAIRPVPMRAVRVMTVGRADGSIVAGHQFSINERLYRAFGTTDLGGGYYSFSFRPHLCVTTCQQTTRSGSPRFRSSAA